ncbi:GIY-YIG nuclease family protein [Streptomyces sp. NPDC015125]|uniref:GIY-YIG nuclease family protein n=1 Tax=Streptomyces sp. NPDC015125 TaxID=3364938 RepID=UPI0036F77CE5
MTEELRAGRLVSHMKGRTASAFGVRGSRPGGRPRSRPDAAAGIELANVLSGAPHRPVVYFVHCGDRVKIGTTRNLKRRMADLSLALEWVVLVTPGGKEVETEYHHAFAAQRIRADREWFWCKGKLHRFLAPGLPREPQALPQRLFAALLPTLYNRSQEVETPEPKADEVEHAAPKAYEMEAEAETTEVQSTVEPLLPHPDLLSLAEIARRLAVEGVVVKPELLRAHKRRHRDFPRPAHEAPGRDLYAYEEVRAYYTARLSAARDTVERPPAVPVARSF